MNREPQRGGALLTVLWISVALSAIAFALSATVRAEFDRAGQHIFATQAELLAEAGVDAALLRLKPGRGGWVPPFVPGQRYFRFDFPAGRVTVEIQAETGKLNVNRVEPGPLARVIAATGIEPGRASLMAANIVAFRAQSAGPQDPSTFSLGRASYEHLEDLLAVPGISAGDLYGRYERKANGEIRAIGGLYRMLTTQTTAALDANYASPVLLRAGGLSDVAVDNILAIREQRPLERGDSGTLELQQASGALRFGLGGRASAYTLRATARLKDRDVSRTVGALAVMSDDPTEQAELRVVRWYPSAL